MRYRYRYRRGCTTDVFLKLLKGRMEAFGEEWLSDDQRLASALPQYELAQEGKTRLALDMIDADLSLRHEPAGDAHTGRGPLPASGMLAGIHSMRSEPASPARGMHLQVSRWRLCRRRGCRVPKPTHISGVEEAYSQDM